MVKNMNTWTTKKGQVLDIARMETRHILAALNMRLRQMAEVDTDARDAQNDFADDFGMDTHLAAAVNLCGTEFSLMETYTQDIGRLAAELGKRGCQVRLW
jgi:hypothetical protein